MNKKLLLLSYVLDVLLLWVVWNALTLVFPWNHLTIITAAVIEACIYGIVLMWRYVKRS